MGTRFRKSKQIAPGVRLNVGKKGASVTLGSGAVKQTFSTTGRKTTSVKTPIDGVSYVKTSGGARRRTDSSRRTATGNRPVSTPPNNRRKKKKKGSCLGSILAVVVVIVVISMIFGKTPEEQAEINKQKELQKQTEISKEETKISKEETETESENIKETEIETETETEKETDPPIQTIRMYTTDSVNIRDAASSDSNVLETVDKYTMVSVLSIDGEWAKIEHNDSEAYISSQFLTENAPRTVWIPQSGSKYHKYSTCSGMEGATEVTLEEAESMGYEPCKKC